MKICIITLGCKVNQCESDSMAKQLKDCGHNVVQQLEVADLYVLNTCAVTSIAEKKSRTQSLKNSIQTQRWLFVVVPASTMPSNFCLTAMLLLFLEMPAKAKLPLC